jgi:hypothetical protein
VGVIVGVTLDVMEGVGVTDEEILGVMEGVGVGVRLTEILGVGDFEGVGEEVGVGEVEGAEFNRNETEVPV